MSPTTSGAGGSRRTDTRDPRRARERALKILFQADIRGEDPAGLLARIVDDPRAWAMLDELDPDDPGELGASLPSGAHDASAVAAVAGRRGDVPPIDDFTRSLVAGVATHREAIDRLIQRFARRWSVGRMPVVDRNALRLGAYELQYESTSPAVVINEIIELAKALSTDDSGRYVNGVLEAIRRAIASGELPAADAAPTGTPPPTDAPPSSDAAPSEGSAVLDVLDAVEVTDGDGLVDLAAREGLQDPEEAASGPEPEATDATVDAEAEPEASPTGTPDEDDTEPAPGSVDDLREEHPNLAAPPPEDTGPTQERLF